MNRRNHAYIDDTMNLSDSRQRHLDHRFGINIEKTASKIMTLLERRRLKVHVSAGQKPSFL